MGKDARPKDRNQMSSLEQSNPDKDYKEMAKRDFLLTAGHSFAIKKPVSDPKREGRKLGTVTYFYCLS